MRFQSNTGSGKNIEAIVVDLSQVQYIDEIGVETLKEVKKEYEKENVRLMLTHCNGKLIRPSAEFHPSMSWRGMTSMR